MRPNLATRYGSASPPYSPAQVQTDRRVPNRQAPTVDEHFGGVGDSTVGQVASLASVISGIGNPCRRDDQASVVGENEIRICLTANFPSVFEPEQLKRDLVDSPCV